MTVLGPASTAVDDWFHRQLIDLARACFDSSSADAFATTELRVVPDPLDVPDGDQPSILLPIGPMVRAEVRSIRFGGTELTVYDPFVDAEAWGVSEDAVWRRLPNGSLVLGWDLWRGARDALAHTEERVDTQRDEHDRFPIERSARFDRGLAHVPVVNELLAVLVDAALALRRPARRLLGGVDGHVLSPGAVLSHDCDGLSGASRWEQVRRMRSFVGPLARGRMPDTAQLRHMVVNARHPRRYYFDDLLAMLELEQHHGFRSVIYILNGEQGRLKARASDALVAELVQAIGPEHEIGMHYNYGFVREPVKLAEQKATIEGWTGRPVRAGRAHYMRFDPIEDYPRLIEQGIRVDESVGWPYDNSYRAGVAGPFRPFDHDRGCAHDIVQMPLTFMDHDLQREDGSATTWSAMFRHLRHVGGWVSVLVHPGSFRNPEYPEMEGVYERVLDDLADADARVILPEEI